MQSSVYSRVKFGSFKFFRNQLVVLNSDEISKLVDRMDEESKGIRQEILKMCWYMRGGLTYEEAMQLGTQERELISKLISENLETTKKSGMPFF